MDSKTYIVAAIPSADSYVWGVSTEDVPHMTLLYLGASEFDKNFNRNVEFIQHSINQALYHFTMEIVRRGTLGDDAADVLFFNKDFHDFEMIQRFRNYLLANESIKKAWDSVEQYPDWTPHLTLGYPDNPAKKHDGVIKWINFDRIAIFGENYSGLEIEIPIKNYNEAVMSMSFDDVLTHYGIKGMKWGVRRTRKQLDAASDDAKRASEARDKIKRNRGSTDPLSNQELQQLVTRMNLERQYSSLAQTQKSTRKGQQAVKEILSVGKTVNEVMAFASSPAGRTIKDQLAGAVVRKED